MEDGIPRNALVVSAWSEKPGGMFDGSRTAMSELRAVQNRSERPHDPYGMV